MRWNHNLHYHAVILRAMPPGCRTALDVGCGRGELAQKMAVQCENIVAIDTDSECLAYARTASGGRPNLTFVKGDVLAHPFRENSFDFIGALASLHHLPTPTALDRFSSLLRPGGTLAIVGLYRASAPMDYVVGSIALPVSWTIRCFTVQAEIGAPMRDPVETLRDIRAELDTALPSGIFRRRLFFRYSFVWRKPVSIPTSPLATSWSRIEPS